jgi:phosphoribosylanthranilate isomerase
MTRIKFCGMTRHEDVEAAVALGVDAIGFVLWPGSPRAVSMAALRDLVKRIPDDVLPVGVFVRPGERDVEAARGAGIRAIQLHGVNGRPAWLADIDVWIAASLTDDGYSPAIGDDCLLLLDAHDPERHGGTGVPIDWTRAARVAAARRIMLAGGLRPATVDEAIRAVRPYGVDVASGIEVRPGVKDPDAMRAFVARVRQDPS